MCVLKKDELEETKRPQDSYKSSKGGDTFDTSPSPVKSENSKNFGSLSKQKAPDPKDIVAKTFENLILVLIIISSIALVLDGPL